MAGEDLLEGDDGGSNDTSGGKGKKHKPLSKGQKIGVGIGLVTILLVIVQIEKSKAASAGTTTVSGTNQTAADQAAAADEAALASGGYGGGGASYDTGTDPATGETYASEIQAASIDPNSGATYSSEFSTLGQDYQTLANQFTALQGEVIPPAGGVTKGPGSTTTVTTGAASKTPAANLANLNAELAKDEKINTPAARSSVTTLKKQITAVKSRS